jgi:hypothetical protein
LCLVCLLGGVGCVVRPPWGGGGGGGGADNTTAKKCHILFIIFLFHAVCIEYLVI